jgi:hypothetical protein
MTSGISMIGGTDSAGSALHPCRVELERMGANLALRLFRRAVDSEEE